MEKFNYSPLKYLGYAIGFQEVPNEISLIFNISNCPYKCNGCHSKYLWENKGNILSNDFESIFNYYKEYITCVCIMGGDWNYIDILTISNICHKNKIKICLYSGNNNINKKYFKILDYYKVGEYNKNLGGLDYSTTNQKFYKIVNNKIEDITSIFTKKGSLT